jgi:uncharacterized protein (TIGR02145 family)
MRIKHWTTVLLSLAFLKCSDLSSPIPTNDNNKIFLTGRVLDKDGKPMADVIAKLLGRDLSDTTDAKGNYSIIEKTTKASLDKSVTADVLDSLQIIKEGQVVTMLDIARWIDSLPDVFIVQRDIYGDLTLKPKSLGAVKAMISGDNIPDSTPKIAVLSYNEMNQSYCGFAYFVYSFKQLNYSVYVNVYDRHSVFIGRSAMVNFPSTAGDIHIPTFNPNNAAPIVDAGNDTTVSINDTIRLHAQAVDSFGSIILYQWDFESDGFFDDSSTTTSNATHAYYREGVYRAQLFVRDNDGNEAMSVRQVTVTNVAPVITSIRQDTVISVKDSIELFGVASDADGSITEYAWDFDGDGTFDYQSPTQIKAGHRYTMAGTYNAVLRVMDDDNNEAKDTAIVTVPLVDADGNLYHAIKIGTQVWTVENLKTTKCNDGTAIPDKSGENGLDPELPPPWYGLRTGAYCYFNIESKDKYGLLYNWYAVSTGKLAPDGWHVPTDAEWDILQNYLIVKGYNWDGTTSGNKIAKAMAAQTDWPASTNTGAIGNDLSKNNGSGFSALPGGFQNEWGDNYYPNCSSNWWSADTSFAFNRFLTCSYDSLGRSSISKGCGCSIRLVRDK